MTSKKFPIEGMTKKPVGFPLCASAWVGLVIFTADSEEAVAQFKKETGHDLTALLRQSPIAKMIDEASGHDRKVLCAFCDWVTEVLWGEEAA